MIDDFIKLYNIINLKKDKLINEEQAIVCVIKDFLKKLFILIKACKLRELTLDLSLPCSDYILSLFERLKNKYKDDLTFASMFNFSQAKMDKYYKLIDKILAYIVVIVLYPLRKWKWIKKHQKLDQILQAKEKMLKF